MPRRKSGRVDLGALRDVLRQSDASLRGHIGPQLGTWVLSFDDPVTEREFVVKYVQDPVTVKKVRLYMAVFAAWYFVFVLFDTQLPGELRTRMIASRLPAVFLTAFIGVFGNRAWIRRRLMWWCAFAFLFGTLSVALSAFWFGTMDTEHIKEVHKHQETQERLQHQFLVINIVSGLALIVYGMRVPMRLVILLVPLSVLPLAVAGFLMTHIPWYDVLTALAVFLAMSLLVVYSGRKQEKATRLEYLSVVTVENESRSTAAAKRLSSSLLLSVLPLPVAVRMQAGETTIADRFHSVSVGFVTVHNILQAGNGPALRSKKLIARLNDVFGILEGVCDEVGVDKVKTISRTFVAIAGAPYEYPEHADGMAVFLLRAFDAVSTWAQATGLAVEMKAGADSGTVMAGVIGRHHVIWDCWGDTVNSAARMASTAPMGSVQGTEAFQQSLTGGIFTTEDRGELSIKGKGLMRTFVISAASDSLLPAVVQAISVQGHSMTDQESLFSTTTASSAQHSLSPQEQRDLELVLNDRVSSYFVSSARLRPDLEEEFLTTFDDWMLANGRHAVKLLVVVASAAVVLMSPGIVGEASGGEIWLGVRFVLLVGMVACHVRLPRAPGAYALAATVFSMGGPMANVLVAPGFLFPTAEFFSACFVSLAMTGLAMKRGLVAPLLAVLAMISDQLLSADSEELGPLAFPLMAVIFAALGNQSLRVALRRNFVQQKRVQVQHRLLKKQYAQTKSVLDRVMPAAVVARLQSAITADSGHGLELLDEFESATVIALDVTEFTARVSRASPEELVVFVNALFDELDALCAKHHLCKVATVGDAYICGAGIHKAWDTTNGHAVTAAAHFALAAADAAQQLTLGGTAVQVRIGIGTGHLLGGLVGRTNRFTYDIFGEAIDVAERMEHTCEPGRVQMCSVSAGEILRHGGDVKVQDLKRDDAWLVEAGA